MAVGMQSKAIPVQRISPAIYADQCRRIRPISNKDAAMKLINAIQLTFFHDGKSFMDR